MYEEPMAAWQVLIMFAVSLGIGSLFAWYCYNRAVEMGRSKGWAIFWGLFATWLAAIIYGHMAANYRRAQYQPPSLPDQQQRIMQKPPLPPLPPLAPMNKDKEKGG